MDSKSLFPAAVTVIGNLHDERGGCQTRITTNPETDYFPQWSPDGSRILFSRCIRVSPFICEIFLMNPDGTNEINLTNNPTSDDDYAKWSPDGSKSFSAPDVIVPTG
ncbi:MAG: PD40 domain-containing protein [Acidobacteria bacterium]|nr:PD40 domain-containing protein [Acidobacteriota bacterium]